MRDFCMQFVFSSICRGNSARKRSHPDEPHPIYLFSMMVRKGRKTG
jgi:hypothetical protein